MAKSQNTPELRPTQAEQEHADTCMLGEMACYRFLRDLKKEGVTTFQSKLSDSISKLPKRELDVFLSTLEQFLVGCIGILDIEKTFKMFHDSYYLMALKSQDEP